MRNDMLPTSRREFLKMLTAAGAFGIGFPLSLSNMAFASQADHPLLVVLHLRGGCDGLNFISPANDPDFIAARSSDLRVLSDGKDAGYALGNGLSPNLDFRLHAAAGGLAELYKQGHLAFVHACGLTDATRSHFVATDMIESGVGSEQDLVHANSGWITRALLTHEGETNSLQAMSLTGNLSGDLVGFDHALSVPDINGGLPYVGGPSVSSALWEMYSNRSGLVGDAGKLALKLPVLVDQNLVRDAQGHVLPYQPENSANYDTAGGLAGPLKSLARLIKMNIGLSVITLDYGNWDTHEYQPGRFRGLIEPLANGLSAFWNDIAAYHDRVIVVGISEFGRRLRSNKSNGTDHGRAGLMFVLNGKVRGGKIYGRWPGLNSSQLEEGVDLAVTTDYRQVLTEVLDHFNRQKNASLFPHFSDANPLGLF